VWFTLLARGRQEPRGRRRECDRLDLGAHPNEIESGDEEGITQRAVGSQWRGDTPAYVDAWLSGR